MTTENDNREKTPGSLSKLGDENSVDVDTEAMLMQGFELHTKGELARAKLVYQDILNISPDYFDALYLLGLIALDEKCFDLAIEYLERAIKNYSEHADAYIALGGALHGLHKFELAVQNLDKAIAINPNAVVAHHNKGNALQQLGQLGAAIAAYDCAIKASENTSYQSYSSRGVAFLKKKMFQEALDSVEMSIKIRPDFDEAHLNRGSVFDKLMKYESAINSYNLAIHLNPNCTQAFLGRGNAQKKSGRFEDAIASYDQAIALDASCSSAYANKSLVLLLKGDYERGFFLYEWRWKVMVDEGYIEKKRAAPLWLGGVQLEGKTILLHSEQGLGDTIQFCRYATLVKSLGAKVILEVQKPLVGLIKTLSNDIQVVEAGAALPEIDYHCPLLSLPYAFKTNINNIPSYLKYLQSDPIKAAKWAQRLGEKNTLRVGLCWAGNPEQENDRNRSMPLKTLIEALPEGIEYISLQKEVRNTDRDILQSRPDILDFSHELDDFTDSAALCEQMDVVISVCTSVAHLSCALGKNTWVLLPYVPDWRWHTDRNDSPWYPTATLYRQESSADWNKALAKVRGDLLSAKNSG